MLVFEAFNDLRREAYERALQMRADTTASAFSPDRPAERPSPSEQGDRVAQHADEQRADQRNPHALAQPGRRRRQQPGGPPAG
ncbi:MAG TPA: hypothetical protein VLI93_15900 [Acetobacteraceae bacterium]|nr:hypothetical protein [Acetobacteraceae bacterium]